MNPPPAPTANAVIQDTIQMEMLQLLRDTAAQNGNNRGIGGCGNCGGHTGQGNGDVHNCCTPDNISFNRRVVPLYCHTHRACNHVSGDCSSKDPGNQYLETMDNHIGRSSYFCGE